ncbi:F169A protein, partial [Galbula dea]|nr:F169A protein [Galbula dea]
MSFPVDLLDSWSHEDLERSGQNYMSGLQCRNPDHPDFFSLPDHSKIPIRLSSVGFVPIYGEDLTHKVLALFAPQDQLRAVALYLADQWWSIDDIVRTSVCTTRQGLHQVKSVGERIVLYVLNRIIYRTQEMEANEMPFLCHGSNAYAKIVWEKGEAIGFYSVKPRGSACSGYGGEHHKLSVLDTMFVRKQHRGRGFGLMILEDFVDSFTENYLGLRYPLSAYEYTVCKQYFEKYPGDCSLLWEVQGAGHWFQRRNIMSMCQNDKRGTQEVSQEGYASDQKEDHRDQSEAAAEASKQNTEQEKKQNVGTQTDTFSNAFVLQSLRNAFCPDPNTAHVSIWTRSSHLKRPRIGKNNQETQPETFQGEEESSCVSESRLEFPAHTSESSEDLEVPKDSTVAESEETIAANESQSVSETDVSPSEKQREKEETPSEPLNGEVTEETSKTSLMPEEETANEVLSGESKLQSENQEPFVPLVAESQAKPSEDTVSEKVLNAGDSEVMTEETTVVEEGTEEQQESRKNSTENAAALALKEELSDNGLPNSMVTEAAEESASENVSPKTASSLEDQNEEAGHNSQETPVALSQSSLIVVELEGVSFQQPSGQEGQKNQLEEHSEESAEQMDQYSQTAAERAADSSSEEAEIEVPIVDRRNLRRKAKGYKGPPKKKGKPA